MVVPYLANLERALSPERLAPYRPRGGDDLAMVTTYFWNVALCQALYPSLGALEVAMRNGIHAALSAYFGKQDWYDEAGAFEERESRAIDDAKRSIMRARKQISPGRLVAALHYGFWTSVLSAAYGESAYGTPIWTLKNAPLFSIAFPHAPAHFLFRRRLHGHFDELRLLRNRVFHYEPVWQGVLISSDRRGRPARTVPLHDLHANILDAIGWVSPTLQSTVRDLDTFPAVHQSGYTVIAPAINTHMGFT